MKTVAAALAFAFLAGWAFICWRYGVNLPFLDQWDRPLIQIYKMSIGQLSFFGDFWPQHNEARKVVPTAISLALAKVLGGRFDTHVELAVGLVLWSGVAYAIYRLARASRLEPPAGAVLALVYLALSGSSRTAYFHLYSVTFERLLPELTLVCSLGLLAARGLSWRTAPVVVALLMVGQYSYPGAIAAWLLVPAYALLTSRRALLPWLFLMTGGALSSLAYFWSYARPAHHQPVGALLDQPIADWARFLLRFLGNPLSGDAHTAVIGAACALVAFAVLSVLALRRDPRAALAWMALGGYSLGQAALATMTRLAMGMGHAMRGDYIVHASYLYVACAALLLCAVPARRAVAAGLIVLSAASLGWMLTPGVRGDLRGTHGAMLAARRCALEGGSRCDPASFWLAPGVEVVRDRATKARAVGVW